MNIGEQIKRLRKKANLSQRELGERIGMTQQQVAQYESGARNPKTDTLVRISCALGCSLSELQEESLNVCADFSIGDKVIVKDGKLAKGIYNIGEILEELKDSPISFLTDGEKIIVYYNSLNNLGKDMAIEFLELLVANPKYRDEEPNPEA